MNADEIAGERIHTLMRRQRMAQTALAEPLMIDQASLSKKLYGKRTWTIDELLMVARVLNVDVSELLPGDDYAPTMKDRGRSRAVRPKGLEPPTFWLGAARVILTLGLCQAILDTESTYVKAA